MTIFGWDMSHFDEPSIGNAVNEGMSYIMHKAGGDANDPELGQWWAGVRGLDPGRVLLCAYWVLYPGNPSARADAFLDRLDAVCPGWRDRPFFLMADCEKWNNNSGTVPPISDVNAFCDRLVARMPKLRPMGYLPDWVYGDISAFRYPVVASSYVSGAGGFKALYPGDDSSHWHAYGGKQPTVLQYTSSATVGGQTFSDANAFRGTLAELTALVAPGWDTTMAITPEDLTAIRDAVWGKDVDPSSNGYTAAGALWTTLQRAGVVANTELPDLKAAVAALAASDALVTAEAVAAALLPALAAAVVAALPAGALTVEQVTAAVVVGVKQALRDGTA